MWQRGFHCLMNIDKIRVYAQMEKKGHLKYSSTFVAINDEFDTI